MKEESRLKRKLGGQKIVIQGDTLEDSAHRLLQERGVTMNDSVEFVLFLQKGYIGNSTLDTCLESVDAVLIKYEVHNAIITGVQLDTLAKENKLLSPLQEVLTEDEGLYGTDEIMVLSIVNVYGPVGFTNYGCIDKIKPGILEELNAHDGEHAHTFLGDTVGAIAAAAASRLAHSQLDSSDTTK